MTNPINISKQYDQLSDEELKPFEDNLLKNYLNNKLTPEEKDWFENILLDKYIDNDWDNTQTKIIEDLLNTNQNLKSKYLSWKNAIIILEKQSETRKIKELITEQLEDVVIPKEETGKIIKLNSKRNLQYFLLAASVLILIGVSITLWYYNKPYSTDKLYALNYEPIMVDFKITRDKPPANQYILKAQNAYLKNETTNTIKFLELAINEEPENWQLYLNQGTILMTDGKFENAINTYTKVPLNTEYYYETALWYKGLCYLKLEKLEEARNTFLYLVEINSYKAEQAKNMSKEIDRILN